MNDQDEFRNDPHPDPKQPNDSWFNRLILITMAWFLLAIGLRACATEYSFAPNTPASFKQTVRKVLRTRTDEVWTETRTLKYWIAGPLTFQLVNGGNTETDPTLPPTDHAIERGLFAVSWVFRGSRDYICYNRAAGSSRSQMLADLNAQVTYWSGK